MSLLMAYFCEYMVDLSTPHGIWRRLCTSSSAEAVLRRLASSRAYSQAGVLPSCIGIPQPHVRVLVFKTILGSHIYDHLTSLRHIRGTSDDSYIDVECDSDTLSAVFGPILQYCVVEHHTRHIRLACTGYDILRQHIFYPWSTFPDRHLAEPSDDFPHPPISRVDCRMVFSFYGHSVRVPHLRVGFTWDRYIWEPIRGRYESIGVVDRHLSP